MKGAVQNECQDMMAVELAASRLESLVAAYLTSMDSFWRSSFVPLQLLQRL